VKVWIPESMVVKMLTSSRVESVAAWSDTMARLVVGTTSRCQATLADYVHPAVKANRPGKCLVVVTVRHPSGETVVRNVTLEVKASKVPSRRSLVGNVR
jgi:Ni,Fe-hydrogenase III component G